MSIAEIGHASTRWSEQGLSHILSIRTALLSNRYDEFWRSLQPTTAAA
jgi:hypothetical protein